MIASSETDANLYYATRFLAPDKFAFLQIRGKKYLLMSDVEVDRARTQACVHQIVSLSSLRTAYKRKYKKKPNFLDLVEAFLKQKRVKSLSVPANFPVQYADPLRKRGFQIAFKRDPFFEDRTIKTNPEIRAIQKALRATEAAFAQAIRAIRRSTIKKGRLYLDGQLLTSEVVKKIINVKLMEDGLVAQHTIVSCAKDTVDPHNEGSGPLYAHKPIIMDIFPRDSQSRYFADFTRTVVRGRASTKVKKMYAAVQEGQEIAFRMIRHGTDAAKIHTAIQKHFEKLGFKTGLIRGRIQGFFHGTGHGLGLDIHEPPRISPKGGILKSGNIVTVEPALYYEDAGGVRLEDVVVVTKTGCKNLTRAPKVLEI
ncbi:MAG: Xaa-Pro peptidase family protein [Candidatus Omnitrophica bacterium]|nr:Xaa-Pro peptidase family protein [Candidatus Omnitrophota bacterium]